MEKANKLLHALNAEQPSISFEIFPPKGELTMQTARHLTGELSALQPDFISVTYSAGGSGNKAATGKIVSMIQDEFEIPSVAHLTCMDSTKEDILAHCATLKEQGIETILALRGDPIPGVETKDFSYAKDLISLLREEGFAVGAAAYPEGHIDCLDDYVDIARLKEKQDAGAQFLVTQLFFDNQLFYRFWDRVQAAGITIPITCGIMPFLSKGQIQRMVFTCGASLPAPIIKLLAKYEHDEKALRKAGIEYACNQLADLAHNKVDGLHVYTMNHADIARACLDAIPLSGR